MLQCEKSQVEMWLRILDCRQEINFNCIKVPDRDVIFLEILAPWKETHFLGRDNIEGKTEIWGIIEVHAILPIKPTFLLLFEQHKMHNF